MIDTKRSKEKMRFLFFSRDSAVQSWVWHCSHSPLLLAGFSCVNLVHPKERSSKPKMNFLITIKIYQQRVACADLIQRRRGRRIRPFAKTFRRRNPLLLLLFGWLVGWRCYPESVKILSQRCIPANTGNQGGMMDDLASPSIECVERDDQIPISLLLFMSQYFPFISQICTPVDFFFIHAPSSSSRWTVTRTVGKTKRSIFSPIADSAAICIHHSHTESLLSAAERPTRSWADWNKKFNGQRRRWWMRRRRSQTHSKRSIPNKIPETR